MSEREKIRRLISKLRASGCDCLAGATLSDGTWTITHAESRFTLPEGFTSQQLATLAARLKCS